MALFPDYKPGDFNHAGQPVACPVCGGGVVVVTGSGWLGLLLTGIWAAHKERKLHRRTMKELRAEAEQEAPRG